jgi:D-glycero-D-manno-heptose 1,7-bisphosphate phosphatase
MQTDRKGNLRKEKRDKAVTPFQQPDEAEWQSHIGKYRVNMKLSSPIKYTLSDAPVKAVFIDKDGTLIPNMPYNVNCSYIMLEEGVKSGLKLLMENDYRLVVVSNQSGIAHGLFEKEKLNAVLDKINELLHPDAHIDHFYFCPHHPQGSVPKYAITCRCRKPQPGMLLEASRDLNIDLSQSWMIGDILHDIEAGNTAGCSSILIDVGNETEWNTSGNRKPAFVAADLDEAARIVLQFSTQLCQTNLSTI